MNERQSLAKPTQIPSETAAASRNTELKKPVAGALRQTATDMASFGDADYTRFQKSVQSRLGIRLCDYKSDQMQRRLRSLAERQGAKSFTDFMEKILRDSAALSLFLDTITINVTEMLRNADRFDELAKHILPEILAAANKRAIKIWSAGCSYGAEAYTLAMLLHEMEPLVPHYVRGTDLDLSILAKANTVSFTEADVAGVSLARRKAHFTDMADLLVALTPLSPRYRPLPHLRNKVQFSRHDLLADNYPTADYDLIVCRNVLIYFTEEAKERIYRGFVQSLKPGGVLFVGGTERLSDYHALGFELIRPFFYRKPGH